MTKFVQDLIAIDEAGVTHHIYYEKEFMADEVTCRSLRDDGKKDFQDYVMSWDDWDKEQFDLQQNGWADWYYENGEWRAQLPHIQNSSTFTPLGISTPIGFVRFPDRFTIEVKSEDYISYPNGEKVAETVESAEYRAEVETPKGKAKLLIVD